MHYICPILALALGGALTWLHFSEFQANLCCREAEHAEAVGVRRGLAQRHPCVFLRGGTHVMKDALNILGGHLR